MTQSPEVPESATKDTQDLLEEETQKEAERQSKLEAHTSEEQEAMDRSTRGRSRSPRISEGMSLEDRMGCLLYTSPSPRDQRGSRMPSSA